MRSDASYVGPITSDYTVPMETPVRVKPMGHGMTSQAGWEQQSRQRIANAAADEHTTEMARIEGEGGRSHADAVARSTGEASTGALHAALDDKNNVMTALESVLGSLQEEFRMVVADKEDVEADVENVSRSLRALGECDKVRQQRLKKEMVRDGLEYALRQHEQALADSAKTLHELVAAFEIEKNRVTAVRQRIVTDVEGKKEAMRIDIACLQDSGMRGTAKLNEADHWKSKTMRYSWEEGANGLLQDVKRALTNSSRLRSKAASLRQEKAQAEAMTLQMACDALAAKADATKTLKMQAEAELVKIEEELQLTAAEKMNLDDAIKAKSGPLAIAQDRLRTRTMRPQREKVRDHAEQALEQEVQLLTQAVEELTRAVQAIEKNLSRLEETRKNLVFDVQSKAQALEIDVQCLRLMQDANRK